MSPSQYKEVQSTNTGRPESVRPQRGKAEGKLMMRATLSYAGNAAMC